MDNKIVKVIFEEGRETMYNSSDLVQWSYGHVLQIEGLTLLDGNVEVHFSLTKNNGNATVHIGEVKDNVITVKFPNYLLAKDNIYQPSYEAYAWVYLTDEASGRTVRRITFEIESRAKPEDYVYTEEEIKTWVRLENEIKDVKKSIPDVPTEVSAFENDAKYAKEEDIPTKVSELENDSGYAKTSELPTKTSQLTNDSGYLTDSKVFVGTYGVTTYEEIVEAYEAGKIVVLLIVLEDKTIMATLTMPNHEGDGNYNFTFAGDENGISHYANIDYNLKKWVYWICDYYRLISDSLKLGNSAADNINSLKTGMNNQIKKITTNYKRVEIEANGKYYLRENSLYLFGGADYDLNFCDASGNTIGKTKSLVIMLLCTEADSNGKFHVYAIQNYKALLTPSVDGMPYADITRAHYIHNTNSSSGAYVYYMRQNEV